MTGLDMAAKKSTPDTTTFKVRPAARNLVNKLAAFRGLRSVADVFEEKDVIDFFNHLLLHEMKKEQTRLEAKSPK